MTITNTVFVLFLCAGNALDSDSMARSANVNSSVSGISSTSIAIQQRCLNRSISNSNNNNYNVNCFEQNVLVYLLNAFENNGRTVVF